MAKSSDCMQKTHDLCNGTTYNGACDCCCHTTGHECYCDGGGDC